MDATRTTTLPIQRTDAARRYAALETTSKPANLVAVLEGIVSLWGFTGFPWAPPCVPLVERTELGDRDVYRQAPFAVRVRRTWAGECRMMIAVPDGDPADVVANVVDGSVVLEIRGGLLSESCSARGARRTYSFPLPELCEGSTLDAWVDGEILVIAARKPGKQAKRAAPTAIQQPRRVIGVAAS